MLIFNLNKTHICFKNNLFVLIFTSETLRKAVRPVILCFIAPSPSVRCQDDAVRFFTIVNFFYLKRIYICFKNNLFFLLFLSETLRKAVRPVLSCFIAPCPFVSPSIFTINFIGMCLFLFGFDVVCVFCSLHFCAYAKSAPFVLDFSFIQLTFYELFLDTISK